MALGQIGCSDLTHIYSSGLRGVMRVTLLWVATGTAGRVESLQRKSRQWRTT